MIPRTYPTLIDGRKAGYMRVFYLTSVTGLTKWIDYIPVKTVAFSAAAEGTTNANGHINVVQVASSTALRRWVDYIPVFEDGAATVPWSTNANGYIPVDQMLDLDFRAGILDSRITFTRADASTCATYFDSTGRMQTAAANVARFDYDPATAAGVTGGELVTNGDFSQGTTGWTDASTAPATAVVSGGVLTLTRTDGNNARFDTSFATTVGKRYRISITTVSGTNAQFQIGTSAGANDTLTARSVSSNPTVDFVATGATSYLRLATLGGVGVSVLDNVSVQEVTFTPRGLLIEESRQNLLLQSRDMTQAAWTKTDVTPARTQVGIDGVANTACLMTEGSAGTATTAQNGAAVTAGSTITGSVVLKRGNTDWVRITFGESTLVDGVRAWFNLNTGAKGAATAYGAGASISSSITSLGGGWYRCSVTCLPNGTYTVPYIAVCSASADSSTTRVSGATYIVDCAQLEVGAFATSIIPTTTTALTRAADSASMTGTNFSSWFNQTAGTFIVEGDVLQTPTATARYFSVGGTAVIEGSTSTGRLWQARVSSTFPTTAGAVTVGATFKGAVAYDGTGNSVVRDGGTVVGDASVPSGNTSMSIGAASVGGNLANSHIRSLRFYPVRLGNSTLQALTS